MAVFVVFGVISGGNNNYATFSQEVDADSREEASTLVERLESEKSEDDVEIHAVYGPYLQVSDTEDCLLDTLPITEN